MIYYIFSLNNNPISSLIVQLFKKIFLGCNIYKHCKISKNSFQINYRENYFNIFCLDHFRIN